MTKIEPARTLLRFLSIIVQTIVFFACFGIGWAVLIIGSVDHLVLKMLAGIALIACAVTRVDFALASSYRQKRVEAGATGSSGPPVAGLVTVHLLLLAPIAFLIWKGLRPD